MKLDPLRWAKYFAADKHGDQKYAGNLPYTHHLAAVEAVLRRFGWGDDQDMLEAGWCHDIVEDTETKLKEIEEMFGEEVAKLVAAVTNEKGENRKIRNALTYPKLRAAGVKAIGLKLADRIANVEQGGKLVEMYQREYEDFRRALYSPVPDVGFGYDATKEKRVEAMWQHLDSLLKR